MSAARTKREHFHLVYGFQSVGFQSGRIGLPTWLATSSSKPKPLRS
jgi:hypothetical protein